VLKAPVSHWSGALSTGGPIPMPMNRLALAAGFDTAALRAMNTAFDDALRELSLDRADPKAEILAMIIECAGRGVRDPARLQELAMARYRM
jgi:hypothetical protein